MKHLVAAAVVVSLCSGLDVGCDSPESKLVDDPVVAELREGIETGDQAFDHGTFDRLLDRHVDPETGTVDYAGLAEDRDELDAYLDEIAGADLAALTEDEQLALLINAYNAYTLELILDHYPEIDSIREISDPWTTPDYRVGGSELSLDQIEHGIIRPLYRDPRIHFAVNCAARDCPYLADEAYVGERLDEQLEHRTEATLTDERFVRVEDETLYYTRVMAWYEEDFVDDSFHENAEDVVGYLTRYVEADVRAFIEKHDGDPPTAPMDYDWSLNDAK